MTDRIQMGKQRGEQADRVQYIMWHILEETKSPTNFIQNQQFSF